MLRLIVFGLAAGAAAQAWRGWPPTSSVSSDTLAVVFCGGLVVAYWWGKTTARVGSVSATATATAVAAADSTSVSSAQNQVNVALFVPAAGQHSAGGFSPSAGVRVPTSAAPWLAVDSAPRAAADLENIDARDVAELLEQSDTEYLER